MSRDYLDSDDAPSNNATNRLATKWEAPQIVTERRGPRYTNDVNKSRFPYSILWTPLPGITALFPFIGHMGITDSRGVCYDFAGPYSIGVDDLAFGKPVIYIPVRPACAGINQSTTRPEFACG